MPLRRREAQGPKYRRYRGNGQAEVGEFEELEGEFGFDVDGEVADAVIEIMTFAVALHDVGEFGVVDVVHLINHNINWR